MAKPGWYLIAYDIADPRRLQRVHRLLKRHALPVQESVFFFRGHEGRMCRVLDEVAELMNLREDDLRAWPVDALGAAWMYGAGVRTSAMAAPRRGGRLRRWLRRWVA